MSLLLQPPGSRSCSLQVNGKKPEKPHTWESVEEFDQKAFAEAESNDFQANVPITARATAWARFTNKLQRAQEGKLRFGAGRHNDVDHMRCAPDILELKWSNVPPDADERGIWLRLYFSEPGQSPGLLLNLNLKLKHKNRNLDQDEDAICAQRRLEKHLSQNSRERG
ncbi:Uncharacterised protein [Corynebacterium kutscheri]|uniref:Uncharacterized protein n=1 Tax=Corynebacterium kutscheri TaxID=35755 RepID=A0AB38VS87_9CORY|nr:hypothetical protein [Corynebacterium kutscheri]VEH06981.1 Uncharacterised protein [Corynebacterium kutscheri]VEH79476.1 Uncharacterised protein [Corynebacterium kutscheri]